MDKNRTDEFWSKKETPKSDVPEKPTVPEHSEPLVAVKCECGKPAEAGSQQCWACGHRA